MALSALLLVGASVGVSVGVLEYEPPFKVIGYEAVASVIGIGVFLYNLYCLVWREVLELTVDGGLLRWRGLFRSGKVSIADLAEVGPRRWRRGRIDGVVIRLRQGGPGGRLAAGLLPGLDAVIDRIWQVNPRVVDPRLIEARVMDLLRKARR